MELIPASAPPGRRAGDPDAAQAGQPGSGGAAVTALYREHALGLIRLAYVMLGSKTAAEDVVQEAFCGLHRRWKHLADTDRALQYVRSSVLNGCRSALRRDARELPALHQPPAISAEAAALTGEERRAVMSALRTLPDRQREVLVLRFYLEQSDTEIARAMGITHSTVRSTTHRALAALGRKLGRTS